MALYNAAEQDSTLVDYQLHFFLPDRLPPAPLRAPPDATVRYLQREIERRTKVQLLNPHIIAEAFLPMVIQLSHVHATCWSLLLSCYSLAFAAGPSSIIESLQNPPGLCVVCPSLHATIDALTRGGAFLHAVQGPKASCKCARFRQGSSWS